MEFKFNVNDIFRQPIVEINHTLIPPGFSGDRRALWDTVGKVSEVVNAMGEASAAAQGLTKPITTSDRMRNSEQKLYLLIDHDANNGQGAVTGMLKTGRKGLYVFDREGQHYQVTPACVLDFYVHESRQRTGLGKRLFEHMLEDEKVEPVKMAIDRPSEKFLGFLNKHYSLNNPIKQMNNYVVFDQFFPNITDKNSPTPVENNNSTPGKKQSANGLQTTAFPSSPYGRYGAPRPHCSMGQIIHNQTSTIQKAQEPQGNKSAPDNSYQMYQQHVENLPTNVTQSAPNIGTNYQYQNQQVPLEQRNFYQQQGDNRYLQATQSVPPHSTTVNQEQNYAQNKASNWDLHQTMQSNPQNYQQSYQNYQSAYMNQGQMPQNYTEAYNKYYHSGNPNQVGASISQQNKLVVNAGAEQNASTHVVQDTKQEQSQVDQKQNYGSNQSDQAKKTTRKMLLSQMLKEEKRKKLRNGTQPVNTDELMEENPQEKNAQKSSSNKQNEQKEVANASESHVSNPQTVPYNQNHAQMYENNQPHQNMHPHTNAAHEYEQPYPSANLQNTTSQNISQYAPNEAPGALTASIAQPNVMSNLPQQPQLSNFQGQMHNQIYQQQFSNFAGSQNSQIPQNLQGMQYPIPSPVQSQQGQPHPQANLYQQGQLMQPQVNHQQQLSPSQLHYQRSQAAQDVYQNVAPQSTMPSPMMPQAAISYTGAYATAEPAQPQMVQQEASAYQYYQTPPTTQDAHQPQTSHTLVPPTTMPETYSPQPYMTTSRVPYEQIQAAQPTIQPQSMLQTAQPVTQQQLQPQVTSSPIQQPQVHQGEILQMTQPIPQVTNDSQLNYQRSAHTIPPPVQVQTGLNVSNVASNITQGQQQGLASSQAASGTAIQQPQNIPSIVTQRSNMLPIQSVQNLQPPLNYHPQPTQYSSSASNIPVNATNMQPNLTHSQPNMPEVNYVDQSKYIPYQNPYPEGMIIGNQFASSTEKTGVPMNQVRYASNDSSPAAARQMSYAEKPFNSSNLIDNKPVNTGVAATPIAVEEIVSASPKLERPRSLSIQPSEDHSDEKNANDIESEAFNEANLELDNVDNELENLTIEIEEKTETKADDTPDNKSTGKRTPSHLTEQGFLDLKFYHSKLW